MGKHLSYTEPLHSRNTEGALPLVRQHENQLIQHEVIQLGQRVMLLWRLRSGRQRVRRDLKGYLMNHLALPSYL